MVPSEFVTRCSASTLHLQITAVQLQGMQVYVEDNYGRKNLEPAFIAGYGIYSMSGVAYWPNSRAAEKSQL